jgi:imidazoleglycerol-phosphate dehydratase
MRSVTITRQTKETSIELTVNLDGKGDYDVKCPIGFLEHMLASFAKHGLFDLSGSLAGDLHVDQHHLVEDTGIVLGEAFAKALGNKAGINRIGFCLYPMDETLARVAVDFGGRPYLVCETALSNVPLVSLEPDCNGASFQTDTFPDFWQGFVQGARCTLHLDILRGRSDHHKMEAIFKAAGRAIRDAVARDPRRNNDIPSTKGII